MTMTRLISLTLTLLLCVALLGCSLVPGVPTLPRAAATNTPGMILPTSTSSPLPTATPLPSPTATATALPSPTASPTPLPSGLYVDAAKNLGQVSRYVFGTNFGPWALLNADVYPQFKQSGLTLIRFPGGNWGDENDMEAWHLDMFMMLCRLINAEPLVSVRLRGGTVERAVAVMQYMRQQGFNVRYWSIGNEPSLYASRQPEWTTEYYNATWRRFALAMKAVDPTILLVGPDTNQFTGEPAVDPKDAQGRDWLREFLKANGDLVDVVAVHRYPFPAQMNERPTLAQLLADAPRWDAIAANLRAVVREMTKRDLPIAITEFNSSWVGTMGGETGLDTFNNALWLADVLGRLIRQGVDFIAQFTLQSNSNIGGYGLFMRDTPTPSYYVYQMWQRFGNQLVYASSDDPKVSLYAARKDGALTLMVINLSDQPQRRPITLDHFAPNGRADVRLFDPQHNAEALPALEVSAKFNYTLPPTSVTLLTIPGK
jgi:hypothetical protein